MVETVGKKLCQARLQKGLTIDEAAHATKMRPDKILALENDDYSRFANNTYAKGFLLIYGRFLRVDVSEQVRTLESPTRVSVEDYQYLNNVPEPPPERYTSVRRESRRAPSAAPLLAFMVLMILAAFIFYLYVNAQRLGSLDQLSRKPVPAETPLEAAAPAPSPVTPAPVAPATADPAVAAAAPEPAAASTSSAEVIRATPIAPEAAPADGMNEVVVGSSKTTWVRIRKDSPDATPIFEGDLYPDAAPLKLRAARIFVEARDPAAVQIRKNGVPIAYQAPSTTIQ
ncbi:MAG TPA: helix-turn-helix domain-containing protein [Chthoniobacteraceae bacterium]|jgi:cytoskeletal protein RodZ